MRKTGFWKTDWFLGVVVSVAMLAAGGSDLIRSLERKAYDMGVQASSRTPLDRVAVVAIDDTSIANLGRWPWPRDRLAKMTDLLAGGGARVVANTVFFFEPQKDPGYTYISRLLEACARHGLGLQFQFGVIGPYFRACAFLARAWSCHTPLPLSIRLWLRLVPPRRRFRLSFGPGCCKWQTLRLSLVAARR